MRRYIFRSSVLIVILVSFYSSISISAELVGNALKTKFTAAQKFAQSGEIDQAIAVYQSLIRSNPKLPEAYNNLAALYLKKNNTTLAKQVLEQGLYAHKSYGVLYESLTTINVAMAREAYSKALQIELKSTEIIIASLSLNSKKSKTKSQIVISKIKFPAEQNKTNTNTIKPRTDNLQLERANLSGEIKRKSAKDNVEQVSLVEKNVDSIETVMQAWSAAWSAQAIDIYLSFYHQKYRPVNGLSHKGWVQARRYRLKKPRWIKVGLSNFKIEKNTGKQAVVSFTQFYRSNSFSDVSTKQVVLLYTDDGWRIFREKSI